ncbi:glutathione peroxidase [Bacillus solimangrovi]|uniref:Glutathione peroxidase homolog BsaA n=1 Tax=Bacillus solimangrovi TaxID=1305675 RepID=A0A1E5LHG9_9BACI|nr:glutathione peroxidase [Bacillus solimangrovi]
MTIYNYSVKDAKGNYTPLSKYEGKPLMIVNTKNRASRLT